MGTVSDPDPDFAHPIALGYPILLDVRGMVAVVVGLGAVGRRKALALIEAGAEVRGVDPLGVIAWPDATRIDLRAEPYQAAHLAAATLAIAAAHPEVNRQVVADARDVGVLVCSASDPDSGQFTTPAVWRSGPITLTVATGGASPALAATLRDRAADALGPAPGLLARLLIDIRVEIRARIHDPHARRLALQTAADPAWLDRITRDGAAATRATLRAALGLD